MLALLETETYELSTVQKLKYAFSDREELFIREEKILNMPVLSAKLRVPVNISSRKTERCFEKLMDALDKADISRVCLKKDFYQGERVIENNFAQPKTDVLWRAKAYELAKDTAEGNHLAVLFGDGDVRNNILTCIALSKNYKNVSCISDKNMAVYCRKICERTGISVIEKPAKSLIRCADVLIIQEEKEPVYVSKKCVAVYEGKRPKSIIGGSYVSSCRFNYFGKEKTDIPEGYREDLILSELIRLKKCDEKDISVSDIVTAHI